MSISLHASTSRASSDQALIRVMVVDDAVVVRGLVSRWIEEEKGLQFVGSFSDGRQAVSNLERCNPDVVILDIEMPVLDGLSALPLLLKLKPNLVVIMASTLTRRNAEISLKALSLGATDYVSKPGSNREVTTSTDFRRELMDKVRMLGGRRPRQAPKDAVPGVSHTSLSKPSLRVVKGDPTSAPTATRLPPLRPFSAAVPRILVIGSSTGGPQALMKLFEQIGPIGARMPILVTQHMPATFTTILAEHLSRVAQRQCQEAVHGEPVKPGRIYIAPGGFHMRLVKEDSGPVIALDDGPLINFCRPAVDALFSSAAQIYGASCLGLILTGMGADGAKGGAEIAAAGGTVIAQDEATSVVWGMPGAAAQAGICAAILPLDLIGSKLVRFVSGDRS